MAVTTGKNYVPGTYEAFTDESIGSLTLNEWTYFELDGYYKHYVSDLIIKDGGVEVPTSAYELLTDSKITLQESQAGFSEKTVYAMIRITNATYAATPLTASGNDFGTMVDNEAAAEQISDLFASNLLDTVYPVGVQYIQYASAASNDAAVALPAAEAPTALFGGTWEKLWDTESVYFRTEGTDADDGRTTGKQLDQMQKITAHLNGRLFTVNAGDPAAAYGAFSTGEDLADTSGRTGVVGRGYNTISFDSANSPNARTSATTDGETRVTNRLMRIWRRTA